MMLSRLARALALGAALALPSLPLRAQDAAEMLLRLDRLEQLVRQLNGQVEQAQNQNRRLEEQLRRFQNDTDFRFKELEGGRGGARPAGQAPGAPSPAGQPVTPAAPRQQRGDAFDPSANPAGPGAPQPLGSPGSAAPPPRPRQTAGAGVVADPGRIIAGEENAVGRDPRAPTDLAPRPPVAPTAQPTTARGQIDLGRQQLAAGEYEAAEGTFRDFTRSRPNDRLASEAVMGLGDSYFQRQRWREAAEQYVDVTTKYGKSARAAEAELKLGIALRGLGATKEACDVLSNHGQKHPGASPAIKQGVQRELQRARCGG
jgi:TolA-binding protein